MHIISAVEIAMIGYTIVHTPFTYKVDVTDQIIYVLYLKFISKSIFSYKRTKITFYSLQI